MEGWYLDTAEDPVVPVGAVASPEDSVDWNWHWNLDETEAEQPEVALRPDLEAAPQTSPESAPSSDDSELDPIHHWSLEEPETIEEVATTPGVVDGWLLYIDRYPEVHAGEPRPASRTRNWTKIGTGTLTASTPDRIQSSWVPTKRSMSRAMSRSRPHQRTV